jgi:hypothetical protein
MDIKNRSRIIINKVFVKKNSIWDRFMPLLQPDVELLDCTRISDDSGDSISDDSLEARTLRCKEGKAVDILNTASFDG